MAIGLGDGNIELTFYLVALIGIGLLATAGMVVSEDSFGPVSDNAAGIAEMSGEFTGEAERVMVSLDAVGNTTKAITKGVAIGSAVIASVALFASFIETIGEQLPSLHATGAKLFSIIQINVANPTTFIGLLIGGSIAFLFSSLAIRAVGRSAGTVVLEVRRQFREHPGIMDYTEKPEYGRVISICTAAAQRELATPALLAILAPVIVGFGINYLALGAFLAGTILTGPAAGQHAVELGWRVGQRQEVHRGRQRGRQGLGGPQGRRHRRHGGRPVQGHGRTGAQPDDQGDEPGLAAHPPRGHHAAAPHRRPPGHRRRLPGDPARRPRLLQAGVRGDGRRRGRFDAGCGSAASVD